MKTDLTEIAFVLDRSGSMFGCLEATIKGFNEFLLAQQQQPGEARFTLALFNSDYEVPYASIPISEAMPLDYETFVPLGSTALLDAMGRTIDELGSRLAAMPEENRPAQVIVAVLTDGEENSSRQFAWSDVASRIQHQTAVYKWTFPFLGANQDAIATAGQMNIAPQNASAYALDGVGTQMSYQSAARKFNALRARQRGDATDEDLRIAEADLADLVAEDDRQGREQDGGGK